MATGRPRNLALCLALAMEALLAPLGCAQPGPFTSHHTMVGGLKASVSQLEFENEKLKKEVGELKADNSRIENQLVQERESNNEKSARLDDAKDLLRRSGGNAQAMGGSNRNYEEDEIPPPVATPKARKVNRGRASPTVRIPNGSIGSFDDETASPPPSKRARDLGQTDRNRDDDDRWLPVARGFPSQVRQ